MSVKVEALIAARDAYLENLSRCIAPILVGAFKSAAEAVKNKANEAHPPLPHNEHLKLLQRELREVPEWGRSRIVDTTKQIVAACKWMRKTVRLIFGTHVVILSCVNRKPDDITLDLPTDEEIVHKFLIEAAVSLNDEPWTLLPQIASGTTPEQRKRDRVRRHNRLHAIMHQAIDDAIKKLVPFAELADRFLADTFQASATPDDPLAAESTAVVAPNSQPDEAASIASDDHTTPSATPVPKERKRRTEVEVETREAAKARESDSRAHARSLDVRAARRQNLPRERKAQLKPVNTHRQAISPQVFMHRTAPTRERTPPPTTRKQVRVRVVHNHEEPERGIRKDAHWSSGVPTRSYYTDEDAELQYDDEFDDSSDDVDGAVNERPVYSPDSQASL